MFFPLLLTWVAAVSSQYIGLSPAGVIHLGPGQVYRDRQTVEASQLAARLAIELLTQERIFSQGMPFRISHSHTPANPVYVSHFDAAAEGRPLEDNEIFDFLDSRFVHPDPLQTFNQPLQEIEVERATSPTRSFPGEGLPPGLHPAPTRPPNRLANLARPTEPSQRAKNALTGTVFDFPNQIKPFVNFGHEVVPFAPPNPPHLGHEGVQLAPPDVHLTTPPHTISHPVHHQPSGKAHIIHLALVNSIHPFLTVPRRR